MPKNKSVKKVKLELGIDIEMYQCHVEAEYCAKIREEIEDKIESLKKGLEKLRDTMIDEKVTSLTVKAPGGSLFKMVVESSDVKVKISRAKVVEQPVLVA